MDGSFGRNMLPDGGQIIKFLLCVLGVGMLIGGAVVFAVMKWLL